MKSEHRHEIEKRLQQRGFKQTSYANWTRDSEFQIVFTLWTASARGDIQLEAEINLKSSQPHSPCFLAKEKMRLTDELIEKNGYVWIDEIIHDLYKEAYNILVAKARIAAEAAITGIESIVC